MSKFQDECQSAAQRGLTTEDFVEIVERHKSYGVSQVETYCTLGDIRHELGCEESEDESVCGTLEDVMDRVWGFCDDSERIWEETLSDDRVREFRNRG